MKTKILLFLIICLGFLLRTWKIDKFPIALYGDEQAFAWNAYNILKLGQDEYGNPYPLQFRSFEDYKAPVPVYLLVPFIKFIGLNAWGIRLPIAIASIITVIVSYLLSNLFFNKKISLIITFLFAISPWHIHLSRGFFESTLALLWFVLGVYFFLKSKGNSKLLFLSMIFLGLSLYSYFTPRILVPIFLLFLFWHSARYWGDFNFSRSKNYLFSFLFLIFLSLPLLKLTFFDRGFSRFEKLVETNRLVVEQTVNRERNASNLPTFWRVVFHNKVTVWLRMIKNHYLEHLSPHFWYLYGDNSLRYFTGNMGMFYLIEFPFFLIGLYSLWQEKRKAAVFFLGWILLSPIPAALVGRSFAVRSLAMLPAPFIFTGYGIYKVISIFNSSNLRVSIRLVSRCFYRFLFLTILVFGFAFSLGMVLIRYYFEYPVYAATWWGWENKAALDYAREKEKNYDYIFLSDFYTGMPLAFAVYNQYDPWKFRRSLANPVVMADNRHLIKLGKYYIGSLDIDEKRLAQKIIPPKSLYIARPEEADSEENIRAPDDGRIIFKIYKTDKEGDFFKE